MRDYILSSTIIAVLLTAYSVLVFANKKSGHVLELRSNSTTFTERSRPDPHLPHLSEPHLDRRQKAQDRE